MIIRYDSVAAYIASFTPADRARIERAGEGGSYSEGLGMTGKEALRIAVEGSLTEVDNFEAYLTEVTPGTGEVTVTSPGLYGSSVNVPAYLAGSPMCMRRRSKREGMTRHVSVYVSLSCSAGVNATDMRNRGLAILGLTQSLVTQGYAVDLYLVEDSLGATEANRHTYPAVTPDMVCDGDCFQVIRVENRPLDLSTSGFVITHPAFTRYVVYTAESKYGAIAFSRTFTEAMNNHRSGYSAESMAKYSDAVRAKLGMEPTDIFVPIAYLGDPVISNPKAWIASHVAQLSV